MHFCGEVGGRAGVEQRLLHHRLGIDVCCAVGCGRGKRGKVFSVADVVQKSGEFDDRCGEGFGWVGGLLCEEDCVGEVGDAVDVRRVVGGVVAGHAGVHEGGHGRVEGLEFGAGDVHLG